MTRITCPDNQVIDFNYDNGGRLTEIVLPKGSQTYTYDSQSGQVTKVNDAASGTTLSYDYDGPLLLSEQWSGGINGMVNYSHNSDFRLQTTAINNQTTVSKVPIPKLKDSPFVPKIADPIPQGVPKNWSRSVIEDAIIDYETSIASRKAELDDFDRRGDGTPIGRKLHARRITQEQYFLKSLRKALRNR